MSGFNWYRQRDILAPYVDAFFERVGRIFVEHDNEYGREYVRWLFPSYIVDEAIKHYPTACQRFPEQCPGIMLSNQGD